MIDFSKLFPTNDTLTPLDNQASLKDSIVGELASPKNIALENISQGVPVEPMEVLPETKQIDELFTEDDLLNSFPNADKAVTKALVESQGVLSEYGIDTDERLSMFMGQMAHESAGFKAMNEYGGGARYEGRADLGNTSPGDGELYAGRGIIQLTGKYNYQKYGDLIGEDLVANPELAADPKTAVKIAAAYWKDRGLNKKADDGDFSEITRRIQGTSTDAYESRHSFYTKFKENRLLRIASGGLSKIDVPIFNHISESEKKTLLKRGRANEPVFFDKDKKVNDPAILDSRGAATVGEAFVNSYKDRKYLQQVGGKDMLYEDAIRDALKKNIAAAGEGAGILKLADKADLSQESYQLAMDIFKSSYPDVKLPVPDMAHIDSAVRTKAAQIEADYEKLHYSNSSSTPSNMLKSLMLYGADLAGAVGAIFSDPWALAVNLYGGAPLVAGKIGVGLARTLGVGALGFGAEQVAVQSNRSDIGLSSGVMQGVENTLTQAGLLAGGQALGKAVSSLWKHSSSKYASKFKSVADDINKGIDTNIKPINPEGAAFMKRQLEDQVDAASKYNRNPYGKGIEARVKFEKTLREVNEDFIKGTFIREVPSIRELPALKATKVDIELSILALTDDPIEQQAFKELWKQTETDIKTQYKALEPNTLVNESTVPVLIDNQPLKFSSLEEGQAFISTARGSELLSKEGASLHPSETVPGEYYIARPSRVEPTTTASARTLDEVVTDVPGRGQVSGSVDDIQTLINNPELGSVKDLPDLSDAYQVKYPQDSFKQRVQILSKDLADKFSESNDKTFDQILEASNERIKSSYSPEVVEAINGSAEFQDILNELKDLRDMKSPGVLECFYGVKDVNDN